MAHPSTPPDGTPFFPRSASTDTPLCRKRPRLTPLVILLTSGVISLQGSILIDTLGIGNAGNTTYGAVGYDYFIGKYEVTNGQYAQFLNAKASASDDTGLYNALMASWGITQTGGGPFSYTVNTDFANKPVNYVNFYDAARFANWVMNGANAGASTETGFYTFSDATTITAEGPHGPGFGGNYVAVASENEWYKAAYHKNDAATGNYFDYPTGSDTAPTAELPPGGSNSANYNNIVVTVTDVGAYPANVSPYGTYDQGGNIFEWNDTIISGSTLGFRGGSFDNIGSHLQSSWQNDTDAPYGDEVIGFRVSSLAPIPEPSFYGAATGLCALGFVVWRRRRM